jgi:hypothetical protein
MDVLSFVKEQDVLADDVERKSKACDGSLDYPSQA